MEATINRLKAKKYPVLPKTLQEVKNAFEKDSTVDSVGKTMTKQNRFYFDTKVGDGFAHQIYASMTTIKFIEDNIDVESRNYLMDGTFKIVPKPFKQCLIISIEYKNNVSDKEDKIKWYCICPSVFLVLRSFDIQTSARP